MNNENSRKGKLRGGGILPSISVLANTVKNILSHNLKKRNIINKKEKEIEKEKEK